MREFSDNSVSHEDGVQIAFRLAHSPDQDWLILFKKIRRDGRLSAAMHQLNRLLGDPKHQQVAATALKRLGLERGG